MIRSQTVLDAPSLAKNFSPQSVGTEFRGPGQLLSDGDRLMVVADGTDCLGTAGMAWFSISSGMVMMPPLIHNIIYIYIDR